jgi:thioredoxin
MAAQIFDAPINATAQAFDRVLAAGLPSAVLFWSGAQLDANLNAALNEIARADAGKLLVVKIKSDENPELARKYNIRATPTLITLREGRESSRAEYPHADALRQHANYLMGRGAKPTTTNDERRTTAEPRPPSSAAGEGKPLTVNDATFAREVLQSAVPVVVDFWAPWCGPCRMIAPALEKIAAQYAGRVRIAKLNVDENPRLAQQYQAMSIPLLVFFKNGRVLNRLIGAHSEGTIRGQVEALLKA